MGEVAATLCLNEGTLGSWVRAYKAEHPEAEAEERGPVEWTRFEKLQREMAKVKREHEFLKAVSAYFAAESEEVGAVFGFIQATGSSSRWPRFANDFRCPGPCSTGG